VTVPPDSAPRSRHDALPIFEAAGHAPGHRFLLFFAHTWAKMMGWSVSGRLVSMARSRTPTRGPAITPSTPLPTALPPSRRAIWRSEEHTSELQSRFDLVCRP